MKLSLWQQFSSNHSDGYMVIGRFETSEQAENAARIYQAVEERLRARWSSLPENQRPILSHEPYVLTNAEREIMQEYSIDSEAAVDWMARQYDAGHLPTAIKTFETHVFFTTIIQTSTRHVPFPALIRYLGGTASDSDTRAAYILVSISATIPHALTANYIKAAVEEAIEDDSSNHNRPWILFYGGQLVDNPKQVSQDIDTYLAHEAALTLWHNDHADLIDHLREEQEMFQQAGDREMVEMIGRQLQVYSGEQDKVEPPMTYEEQSFIERLIDATWIMSGSESRVTLNDGHLQMTGITWPDDLMAHGLTALIAWLRALGCRNVSYEFVLEARE